MSASNAAAAAAADSPPSIDDRADIQPAARIRGLRPYRRTAPATGIDLFLDANEGPAPPAAVLEVLAGLDPATALRRYPDARSAERGLARSLGVEPERVLLTNGSDAAIDRLCRAVLEPGRRMLVHAPSFEIFPHAARLAGAAVDAVPWLEGSFPADDFRRAIGTATALVAMVSPNNPSGGVVETTNLHAVADAAAEAGALLVVDQAYVEFADEDPGPSLLERGDVVLLRTCSKARGLAGLRIGAAIGPARVIEWMRTAGGPFEVTGPSLAVAEALFGDGEAPGDPGLAAAMRAGAERVRFERARLAELLASLGARPLPSQANFVLAAHPECDRIRRELAGRGIAVRTFPGRAELEGHVRIGCPADEACFDRLVRALRAALADRSRPTSDQSREPLP